MNMPFFPALSACLLFIFSVPVLAQEPEFISDHPGMILGLEQGWGELGLDRAAHASDKEGERLSIGATVYTKGLGHHATGNITLALDGKYTLFEAEVGVQPCDGGSVTFRVLVDGELRFERKSLGPGDAAQPVHVGLAGAQELRLEALDAGDGINCDMANWAEARLTPATGVAQRQASRLTVDVAPFGRIVTWDPNRVAGARASRIEESRSDDVFTEADLKRNANGTFTLPVGSKSGDKLACIGIQWLERRRLREVILTFVDSALAPLAESIRVEGWFGESAWQGEWKRLDGDLAVKSGSFSFQLGDKTAVQTRKLRWIVPTPTRPTEVRLSAFTRSRWAMTNIFVQCEPSRARGKGTLTVYNGEALLARNSPVDKSTANWTLSQTLRLPILHSLTSQFSDSTVLQFRLPSGNVGVAVRDVLTNDCVYLPEHGLFVAREPLPVSLTDYKRRIAGRKTILDEVRHLPDQTREQAMEKTHHDCQREGPVLLSLARNNSKIIVERDGLVRFRVEPFDWSQPWPTWYDAACELRPRFGTGNHEELSRHLDGDWLPIPVISATNGGIRYIQRTLVAPLSDNSKSNACMGLIEFTAANEQSQPANASLTLKLATGKPSVPAQFQATPTQLIASVRSRPAAFIQQPGSRDDMRSHPDGTLAWERLLVPGEKATVLVWLPGDGVRPEDVPSADQVGEMQDRTGRYWRNVLGQAVQVDTPDKWLNDVIRSSQVRCLIAARNEDQGGRVAAGIAAMSYGPLESEAHSVIRGMDFMGHGDFAQRSLDYFIHRYNTNGFLTTGYTTFGTAWHLWTLAEHYQLTRDTNWLRGIAPEVARVGHWIIRQTEKTKRLDSSGEPVPEFGLMPPGVLADWNAFAFHFAMNAYYSAALREAGRALAEIRHPDARLFIAESEALRRNTLRGYAWAQGQSPALPLRDGTWVSHYPSQLHSPGKLAEFFPGQDAGRSWCYDVELGAHQLVPAGVLPAYSREVERMMNHMEDVQFLAEGWFDYPAAANHTDWFNLGGFSKVQPYYTRNAEIYALRDDIKPFIRSYFNTLASMINPEVLTFWEHFHHTAAWDKTHETGYFLHQTRTMLVQERGDELWLAPFVTSDWLADGRQLTVLRAPTRFGAVSFQVTSHTASGFMESRVEPPTAAPLKSIVLRLRHPEGGQIRSVTLDGKRLRSFDLAQQTIRFEPSSRTANLRVNYEPSSVMKERR